MSKTLIGTLVGALILFFWQFASWTAFNIHGAENTYTPNQEKILSFLTENLEEGHYFMPTMPPGADAEAQEAYVASAVGKPWAKVSYHRAFEMNMGMNMFRGFIVNLVCVFLLIWVLGKFGENNFVTTLLASLAVGLIGWMNIPYIDSIWFETNSMGHLIDAIAQWGLVGAFLGWLLNR